MLPKEMTSVDRYQEGEAVGFTLAGASREGQQGGSTAESPSDVSTATGERLF
jgi:hypothetical protein